MVLSNISIEELNLSFIKIYGQCKFDSWIVKYPIFADIEVKKWLLDMIDNFSVNGKASKEFQISGYLKILQKYCNFWNKIPSDLLKEVLDERNTRLKKYIHYKTEVEINKKGEKNNPVSIINGEQSRIKSFFKARGSPITFQRPCYDKGENKDESNLTQDSIRLIEGKLNSPQYRLILKFQSQLGLRIEDILEKLTSGKYHFEKYLNHYYIKNFETQKEKIVINFLFIPNELEELIKSITGISDLLNVDLSKLFLNRIGRKEELLGTNGKKFINQRIDESNYLKRIKQISKDVGIEGNVKTHSFRKFFRTMVGRSNIGLEFREHLTGHKLQNLASVYNRDLQNIDWFYSEWLKILSFISIDYIVQDETNEKVKELSEDNVVLKKQLEIMQKEMESMKEKMKELFLNAVDSKSVKFIIKDGKKIAIDDYT